MIVIKTIDDMRNWRRSVKGTLGFVPTMGYLHVGHVSLIKLAQADNDHVVVSIFVNPKQFAPNEDFNRYPRDIIKDLSILEEANVTAVFLPDVEEIYPENFETIVSMTILSKKLEGAKRPGHFDGVTTIITKLFNIVQPMRAYFGQKDAQQVVIIKKLVRDLAFPIAIIVGPTIRQINGLALSSRNSFLTISQKQNSAGISQSLGVAQKLIREGERDPKTIKNSIVTIIEKSSGVIDYISIADPQNLNELSRIQKKTLISLAVFYGKTRLIDNCIISL
jgi:pantoate--beta-alanine ligase